MWEKKLIFLFLLPLIILCCQQKTVLKMATTTSVENSGILEIIIDEFEKETNIKIHYVASGTGQALRIAEEGGADLVFVHDREAEQNFVSKGFGIERTEVAYNYFLIVGPKDYKKEIRSGDTKSLLEYITQKNLVFVSRGDDSGTDLFEKRLWKNLGIDRSKSKYLETGSSMIATLRVASEKKGFALTDSATFLSHKKELNLVQYSSDTSSLKNVYSLILVNSSFKKDKSRKFIEFIKKGNGNKILKKFGLEKYGAPLFYPIVMENF